MQKIKAADWRETIYIPPVDVETMQRFGINPDIGDWQQTMQRGVPALETSDPSITEEMLWHIGINTAGALRTAREGVLTNEHGIMVFGYRNLTALARAGVKFASAQDFKMQHLLN
ncbi:MAG: hypothetical protein JO089_07310 [Alphaproteobacteria bacterium]|nr:hypothetical protein [Alphaproteobacteria bacterium]